MAPVAMSIFVAVGEADEDEAVDDRRDRNDRSAELELMKQLELRYVACGDAASGGNEPGMAGIAVVHPPVRLRTCVTCLWRCYRHGPSLLADSSLSL
jgi:hypothetical protein